jgi:hypothetical protein
MVDRRAKKIEKQRKKRDLARRKGQSGAAGSAAGLGWIVRLAARCPAGPAFISAGWDEKSPAANLVTTVVSRRLPDGALLAGVALVDRTCLGVKDAFVTRPMTPPEWHRFLAWIGEPHGGIKECEPLLVQSVVYHAIDYAARLGFRAHPDFPELLFGPRPEKLLDTPHMNDARPEYIAGPRDDARAVMAQLDAAVGRDHYHFTVPADAFAPELHEPDEEDEEDERYRDRAALPRRCARLGVDAVRRVRRGP